MKSSSSKLVAIRTDPPRIPDHEVLRCIGRGSYGEVWLARSVTGALRAVKVVRREDFELDRTFEREFDGIRKFEPISRDHQGLVHILHVGRNDEEGFYYYVMELGDDRDRGSRINPAEYEARTMGTDRTAHRRLSIEECIDHGITLADALVHLHEHGLTHRDIKPSNIIFVNGKAKLADIGLVAAEGQHTYVGTEGFVPPEGPGSASADLYSLGMVLYEMSTGNDRLQFPELPDDLGNAVNRPMWRALNDVVCKACAPNPKKRFPGARPMADALRAARKVRRNRFAWLRRAAALPIYSAIAAFSLLVWRHQGDLPWPPGRFHDLNPPLPPVSGAVYFESTPKGADIFFQGRSLGKTPATINGIPVGAADFTLRLARHRETSVRIDQIIPGGTVAPPPVKLSFYDPPVPGQPWTNSIRMLFDPRGLSHVSRWPVSYDQFREVLQIMSGTVIDENFGDQGTIYMISVPPEEALRYCDRLTESERLSGFLPDDWCYRPEPYTPKKSPNPASPELKAGATICFRCVAERTGKVVFESVPSSARVFENGRLLKLTPFTMYGRRTGPVKFTVTFDGFEDAVVEGDVPSGGTLLLKAQLKQSRRPVTGKEWQNSLGMVFQPVDQLFFSQWETRVQDFAAFASTSGTAIRPPAPPVPAPPDGTHPVTRITRAEAQNFCRWLTQKERTEGLLDDRREYRLPTDAEWSAAAGAPDIDPLLTSPAERHLRITGVYPWLPHYLFPPLPDAANPKPGGNLGDLTAARAGALTTIPPEQVKAVEQLAYDDGSPFTAPVGSFRIAEFKLHDMAGNVSEFVADTYGGKNPANAPFAVTRGASWATPATAILELNTQFRRAVPPDAEPDSWTGFRAVLAPVSPPSSDSRSPNSTPPATSPAFPSPNPPVSPEPPR